MKFRLRHIILTCCLILSPLISNIQAFSPPNHTGYITDQANILSADQKNQLASMSKKLEAVSGAQVATLIVPSLKGDTIENAAEKTFKSWGIGQKEKDNGVLFIIAINDKKMRIEVGYGLEGDLPDGKVGAILDQYVLPYFKAGNLSQGIISGHLAIIGTLNPKVLDQAPDAMPQNQQVKQMSPGEVLILLILLILIIIGMIISPTFRTFVLLMLLSGRGGSRGNDGFGGFGGGGSGGGGSSRSW